MKCFIRRRGQPPYLPFAFGLLGALFTATPISAAERIQVTFGPLQRSIPLEALEQYAREGEFSSDLRPYSHYVPAEQQAPLRRLLQTRLDLEPVAVAQFLYTQQGEGLLRRMSGVIRTESNLPGFYGIRSALILAAADPEGLTPLNVLKKFPLKTVRVDLEQVLKLVAALEANVNETQAAIAAIEKTSGIATTLTSANFSRLPDPRQRGPFRADRITRNLMQPSRNRTLPVDVYLPHLNPRAQNSLPSLIVISHGLGSNRSTYEYLANHLVSFGFAVAVPEHAGSNSAQLEELLAGRTNQVAEPQELVDRPLDIKFMLDELTYLAETDPQFRGRLNPNKVGVIGQSLGAYTALALAGASINRNRLAKDCLQEDSLNLSLVLQCGALELPPELPDLKDSRVKAILPINPLGSSLLGPETFSSLTVPVMIASGGADTVTPALAEQIRPFSWLTLPDRYLLMLANGTHFSSIDVSQNNKAVVSLPSQIVGPNPAIAHRYLNAMSVAFFEVYLENQDRFRPFLTPTYAQFISEPQLPLSLVNALPAEALEIVTAKR